MKNRILKENLYFTFNPLTIHLMDVKIDTKEKFNVITPVGPAITANMTGELELQLLSWMEKDIPHIILNLEKVSLIDLPAAVKLADIQQRFYEQNFSLIICCLQKEVETLLEQNELSDIMNITPTESEAWDIMHMEEIERELLDDENV